MKMNKSIIVDNMSVMSRVSDIVLDKLFLTKTDGITLNNCPENIYVSFSLGTRLAPVFKTIFHQCFISYLSLSNLDGSVK